MFEYKITLDDDDYLLFNQYHVLNSPVGKRYLITYKMVIPLFCFMIFVVISTGNPNFQLSTGNPDYQLLLIEVIFMTIFSILWIRYSQNMVLKSMQKGLMKMKKEGRLPYNNEAIIRFDDEAIHEISPNTESKTKYSLVEKIAVTEKAIYIYCSSAQAVILPITAFSEDNEKQKFLEFVNLQVDGARDTK